MKTLQEAYKEIVADEELKKAFAEAVRNGKTAEFLKERGCEVTQEELVAYLAERSGKELSDDELDNAAGGDYCNEKTKDEVIASICTGGVVCAFWTLDSALHGHLGQKNETEGRICN